MESWYENLWLSIVIIGLIWLAVFILFVAEQQRTLKAVDALNRHMKPGEVWLQLIPLFGLVWQFRVVKAIADSLRQELQSRNNASGLGIWEEGITDEVNIHPTYTTGQWYCITTLITCIPFVGFLTFIFALILWITYWSQLVKYRKMLSF